MLPFLNMLDCFLSIKCYDFFQSSSLRYTNFKLKHSLHCYIFTLPFSKYKILVESVFPMKYYKNMCTLITSNYKLYNYESSFEERKSVN